MKEKIQIDLNSDEALVLFEFLSRFSNGRKLAIEDQAEERVLWNILTVLEKTLGEPFSAEYLKLLEESRTKVRDK